MVAWYVNWGVWEYIVLRRAGLDVPFHRLLLAPVAVWNVARLLSRDGTLSFGLSGERVYLAGWMLWTVWAFETVTVLGLASWLPYYLLRRLAFCESCGRRCDYRQGVLSIGYGSGDHGDSGELRARLEQKDLTVLEEDGPADMDAPRWFRIDLQHCPGCPDTHLLSAFLIRVSYNEQGFRKEKARRAIDRLLLDAGQAEEIKRIKDRLWPPIADVASEPPAEDEEADDIDNAVGDDAPESGVGRRAADA